MKVWSTVLTTGVALTTLAACSGGSIHCFYHLKKKLIKSRISNLSNSVSNGRGDWLTTKSKKLV